MPTLAESIDRLAAICDAQLGELRRGREERDRERWERPEFRAELAARKRALRPLSFLMMARAIPDLAAEFERKIPERFWTQELDVAVVSCPCGQEPPAAAGVPEPCACGRRYLFDGVNVRVGCSPEQQPAPAVD